jgi:hypothetical protein
LRAFPKTASVVELARDKGWIGQALRTLPDWLRREADRWAEWNALYQEKHDLPRLPSRDPWQVLLDAPAVHQRLKEVCRAAQSQLVALRRLCGMATGRATLNTDWLLEARKAKAEGDQRGFDRAIGKVADAYASFDFVWADLKAQHDPELLAQAVRHRKQLRAQLVKRGHRAEAESLKRAPQWDKIRKEFSVECYLVEQWVNFPGTPLPGLMFWSNKAVTKWLCARVSHAWGAYKNLGLDHVKKTRQRLGLIPVSEKNPPVWDVVARTLTNGEWELKGWGRNAKVVFGGTLKARA